MVKKQNPLIGDFVLIFHISEDPDHSGPFANDVAGYSPELVGFSASRISLMRRPRVSTPGTGTNPSS